MEGSRGIYQGVMHCVNGQTSRSLDYSLIETNCVRQSAGAKMFRPLLLTYLRELTQSWTIR